MMQVRLFFFILIVTVSGLNAQSIDLPEQQDRWSIQPDGSIGWQPLGNLPHSDHIEMSGEKISMWIQYGVDTSGKLNLNRSFVFPSFRLLPQRTVASMMYSVADGDLPRFLINDRLLKSGTYNAAVQPDLPENVISIRHKGIMEASSFIGRDKSIKLVRTLFPSVTRPVAIEKWVFINTGKQPAKVEMEYLNREAKPAAERTTPVQHSFIISTVNEGVKDLQAGDSVVFAIVYQAMDANNPFNKVNVEEELSARKNRVNQFLSLLQLETPDEILNTAFAFAKIRATESIYKTKGGYLHGPGGLRYYAAIWANDQAEYINPYFAISGDRIGNLSAMNAYRLFASYMNPDYNALPSSIVAEGDTVWKGAGDRGDQAMIAYGASRYALTYGSADSAKVLWPLISWCLEYSHRHINTQGVVESKSDELEGRFPSGKANLSTNCLYYDALVSAALLGRQLQLPKQQTDLYTRQAAELKENIEKYFGADLAGFHTYKYYETNDVLRAWICMPLTMGIYDRSKGTIDALFSPKLWTADGLATQAGQDTFWDRSTLYALRGVLQAGATEQAMTFLHYYSRRRLLGEHVPYAVEAYPEGNQRHLSAESGLYCRIFTEGLFGIRPTGFRSFNCTPRLPKGWNEMALNNIHAFGKVFDLKIVREGKGSVQLIVTEGNKSKVYKIKEAGSAKINV